jgi:hypothetical protein
LEELLKGVYKFRSLKVEGVEELREIKKISH